MLNFIRERAQGWVAWFIVGLITIPFALWGVNSYLTGPSDVVVAKVNGDAIPQAEYQQAVQQYRDRMRTVLKDQFDPSVFDSAEVKRNVLNSLIDKKLLASVAQESGQTISNATLLQIIHSTPAFQKDGKFDSERYAFMLARIGLNPERYESELRTDTMVQQLTNNVQSTSLSSNYLTDDLLKLEKQRREIAYGVIPALSLLDKVEVTEQQVKDYYTNNASNYIAPERLTVNYIDLSVESLMKSVDVTDDALKQYYLDNQDQFVGPEQRRASHILIEGDDATAVATLESVQERLKQGEKFSDLAKELSQDAGSAKQGGDLGFFQRGVMDSTFENTVFGMNDVGQVSDIIKTEFGHHLVELTGIKKPEGKSFEQAKAEVEKLYRRQQAEKLFYEKAERLADLSYENPESLDVVAEDLDLEIKTSAEFQRDRNTVGIAKNPKVVSAAFSEDVLVNDLNSAVIELGKSELLVIHKKKHTEASQLDFDAVAPAIKEQLRFTNAADQAKQQGEALVARIKAGEKASTLFTDNQWHAAKFYDRADDEISQQILTHAFSVAKPKSSTEPEVVGFTAQNGNYVIVKVSAIEDADASKINSEDQQGLNARLTRVYGDAELQAFITQLKSEAKIEVFDKYL